MHLQLDAQRMRAAMDLWRQELGATSQVDVLARLSATLGGWVDLLRLCTPAQDDAGELQSTVAEVRQLREWADEGAAALRLIEQVPRIESTSKPTLPREG